MIGPQRGILISVKSVGFFQQMKQIVYFCLTITENMLTKYKEIIDVIKITSNIKCKILHLKYNEYKDNCWARISQNISKQNKL